MGRSQAMRIGKFILRTVLFLLLAAVAGAGLYLYPAWKAAKALGDEMELPCKAFVLEVELDRDAVPREQEKMLPTAFTGVNEDGKEELVMVFINDSVTAQEFVLEGCGDYDRTAVYETSDARDLECVLEDAFSADAPVTVPEMSVVTVVVKKE